MLRTLLAILLLYASVAIAEETTDLDQARQLLTAGKAEQAVVLLKQDMLRLAGSENYDYLLGKALYQAGHAGEALFAFDRVLMVAPNNVEVRLLAARINLERGDPIQAGELIKSVSAQRLSAEQQQELERMRGSAAIPATGGGTSVQGYVLAGIGWDSNVTSGPSQTALLIPGISTTSLTSLGSASKNGDMGTRMEVGVSVRKAIGEDTWLTGNTSIHQGINNTRKDMQEGIFTLDLGGLHRIGHDFFGASVLAQDFLLGNRGYRNALGTSINWVHPLANHATLTSYFRYLNSTYHNAIDDTTRKVGGVMRDATIANGAKTLQYGLYVGTEDAKDPTKPQFSYHLFGAHVAGNLRVSDALLLSAGVVCEFQRHLAAEPLYSVTRHDSDYIVGVAADYHLSGRWHFIPQYTHTRNVSNVGLYQYSRNTILLQIKWDFGK